MLLKPTKWQSKTSRKQVGQATRAKLTPQFEDLYWNDPKGDDSKDGDSKYRNSTKCQNLWRKEPPSRCLAVGVSARNDEAASSWWPNLRCMFYRTSNLKVCPKKILVDIRITKMEIRQSPANVGEIKRMCWAFLILPIIMTIMTWCSMPRACKISAAYLA